MSRLNTMYPDDEFLKNISDMMGKLDNKNETEIKQEIEQIGYKEFYRYSKEKDVYIKQLKEENKQLKENNMSMQEEMARTWKKADLYKEVIDEVRKFIEDWLFDAGGNGASMTYEDINELLQILDKVIGDDK